MVSSVFFLETVTSFCFSPFLFLKLTPSPFILTDVPSGFSSSTLLVVVVVLTGLTGVCGSGVTGGAGFSTGGGGGGNGFSLSLQEAISSMARPDIIISFFITVRLSLCFMLELVPTFFNWLQNNLFAPNQKKSGQVL